MTTESLVVSEIRVDSEDIDADGFVSLWSVALASTEKDSTRARELASRLLGFLCKKRCPFVCASATDVKYLDDWFERDEKLLYDWTATSERVDVLAQYAHVPFQIFVDFLKANKFKPEANHNPRRAMRVEWFSEDWNVG